MIHLKREQLPPDIPAIVHRQQDGRLTVIVNITVEVERAKAAARAAVHAARSTRSQ